MHETNRRNLLAAIAAALTLASGLVALAPAASSAAGPPMYLYNLAHTGFEGKEKTINAATVGKLAPEWVRQAEGSVSSEPILANGLLYWGSWDGLEHATNPATGEDVWTTYLGQETKEGCSPEHIGVASSATVTTIRIGRHKTEVLLVGGGEGSYYALNANTGEIIWSTFFGSPSEGYFMWSSPSFYKGGVYIGVASIGDCPLIPGETDKLNPATGAIEAKFNTTTPGCIGAGPWSSPTIDTKTGMVYEDTGTDGGGFCGQEEPYAQAMLEFTSQLELKGYWKPPQAQQVIDGDFGATPTLFSAKIDGVKRELVGAANKNGIFYAFERGHVGEGPVWESEPIATIDNTIDTTAWDGKMLYIAGSETEIEGEHCEDSIRAVSPATGKFVWSDCLEGGTPEAALTAVKGVVFASIGSILYGVASQTGQVLLKYQDTSYNWFYSPPMVAQGALYIGNSDGKLFKFTLEGH